VFWSHGVSTTSLKVESLGVVALVGARIQLPFWLSASSGTAALLELQQRDACTF